MRDRILYGSVRGLLPAEERVKHVAHLWCRHRLMVPYSLAAFVAMLLVGIAVDVEHWSGRVGLGLAGVAVAAMATTQYRVLALTSEGLVLFRSSRIRQRALEILERPSSRWVIEPLGSNLVITEWGVGPHVFSVVKRHQAAMVAISQR